jgi:hypothetical protein
MTTNKLLDLVSVAVMFAAVRSAQAQIPTPQRLRRLRTSI